MVETRAPIRQAKGEPVRVAPKPVQAPNRMQRFETGSRFASPGPCGIMPAALRPASGTADLPSPDAYPSTAGLNVSGLT